MKILLILFFCAGTSASASDWLKEARRLSGETDSIRTSALAALESTTHLEDELRKCLQGDSSKTNQSLALDVISTLHLKSMWSDVVIFSQRDEWGMSYLTLLALEDEAHRPELKRLFLERLENPLTSSVSKMVILDSFLRMKIALPLRLLQGLLGPRSTPEVRSSALYYVRGMVKEEKIEMYLRLLQPYQDKTHYSSQFQAQLKYL